MPSQHVPPRDCHRSSRGSFASIHAVLASPTTSWIAGRPGRTLPSQAARSWSAAQAGPFGIRGYADRHGHDPDEPTLVLRQWPMASRRVNRPREFAYWLLCRPDADGPQRSANGGRVFHRLLACRIKLTTSALPDHDPPQSALGSVVVTTIEICSRVPASHGRVWLAGVG
jgi:hypothetical protein